MSLRGSVRSERIAPPDPPDEARLEQLRANFRALPQISEAWVTGTRMTIDDGPPRESTVIALVLDPLHIGKDQPLEKVMQPFVDACGGVSADHTVGFHDKKSATRRELGEAAELIYTRAPESA
jgi:hypothetical protein